MFKDNGSFCVKPWMFLMLGHNGEISACAKMTTNQRGALGSTKDKTLNEAWNSPAMMEYRKNMLAGNKMLACTKCYNREAANGDSPRTLLLKSNMDKIESLIANTDKDGFNSDYNISWLDIRFSNKCNFKCRMCNPGSSTAWMQDAHKLKKVAGTNQQYGFTEEYLSSIPDKKLDTVNGLTTVDYLKENITKIERINFAGGEPLIMDEHYELLNYLIANNNFCNLTYHTNMSKLKYKNWNVLDLWSKWPKEKLKIWPSIDEIGERADLIRKVTNTTWTDIEENLNTLTKNGFILEPHITVTAYNVFRLPEILMYFYNNEVLVKDRSYANFSMELTYDYQLHVSSLPNSLRNESILKINTFCSTFKDLTGYDVSFRFKHILTALNIPQDIEKTKQLIKFTAELDAIRNEDTYKVIPELEVLKTYM
jgi:radical SAM protein with 4Fe4S-binding SPASM domain